MKKFQSIFATLFVAVLMVASFSSCSSKGEKAANEIVEQANQMLPQRQGPITAEKAKLDGKTIVFEYTISPAAGVDVTTFKESEDAMKSAALAQLQGSGKEAIARIKEIAEDGYSVKYVYTSGGDTFNLVLTPEDLLGAMK